MKRWQKSLGTQTRQIFIMPLKNGRGIALLFIVYDVNKVLA
jgi:hypothetical protein